MTLLASPPGEVHVDVEVQFVFEVERVPVKCLHQDNVGVAAQVTLLPPLFSQSIYFSLQGAQLSQTGFQCSFIILVIFFILVVLGDNSPT